MSSFAFVGESLIKRRFSQRAHGSHQRGFTQGPPHYRGRLALLLLRLDHRGQREFTGRWRVKKPDGLGPAGRECCRVFFAVFHLPRQPRVSLLQDQLTVEVLVLGGQQVPHVSCEL